MQHVARVSPQVIDLSGPGHGADKQLPLDEVRLDWADPRRSVPTQRAEQGDLRDRQAGHTQPGNHRCARKPYPASHRSHESLRDATAPSQRIAQIACGHRVPSRGVRFRSNRHQPFAEPIKTTLDHPTVTVPKGGDTGPAKPEVLPRSVDVAEFA